MGLEIVPPSFYDAGGLPGTPATAFATAFATLQAPK
jgi:hypothetical protein